MATTTSRSKTKTVSDVLREAKNTVKDGETVTVGYLLQLFGVRGFAFLMLSLALMNVVIFMVPGLSLLFGLPLVIFSVQMVLGFKTPLVPAVIRRRSISRLVLMRGLDIGVRGMARAEHLFRPRFWLIAGPHMDRVHSLFALLMAMMMTIPIPLLNLSPSFGLIALALGMIQRDGIFIAVAYAIGAWSLWLFGSLGHIAQILTN